MCISLTIGINNCKTGKSTDNTTVIKVRFDFRFWLVNLFRPIMNKITGSAILCLPSQIIL